METEVAWIRERIERLRAVLRSMSDEKAVDALTSLIAEAEERLDKLEAQKLGRER